MKQDGRIVTHGSMYEKVLGYLYNPLEDSMQLKRLEINGSANTKRSILAEASKIFDPLSVTIPVTVILYLQKKYVWHFFFFLKILSQKLLCLYIQTIQF